jgi:hypothetical protein
MSVARGRMILTPLFRLVLMGERRIDPVTSTWSFFAARNTSSD